MNNGIVVERMLLVCREFAVSSSKTIGSKYKGGWILLCKLVDSATASGGKVTSLSKPKLFNN